MPIGTGTSNSKNNRTEQTLFNYTSETFAIIFGQLVVIQ